jgi:hypothetical protein
LAFDGLNTLGNLDVTDMMLQFSSARQSAIFEFLQTEPHFLFYLALSFALIGGVLLLIRPALWRPQTIISYLLILLAVFLVPTREESLFFSNIELYDEDQEEKIFSPQAVILNVGNEVEQQLNSIFDTTYSENTATLLQIENLRLNNLNRQIEIGYYNEICAPVGGQEQVAKYIGTNTHILAQSEEGRIFANRMAHSYFNLKHVYKLNDYYYKQASFNPLVSTAITPVYGTMLTGTQSAEQIERALDKRMRAYINDEDMALLGWDKKNVWQYEANGIFASIKQVDAVLKAPKALPVPPFMLDRPLRGMQNDEIVFRQNIAPYITPYGFKKQMDHPVIISFGEKDTILNCLDFHERTVQKISEDFVQSDFFQSEDFSKIVTDFEGMLPPNMQENAYTILVDNVILPHLGQTMYRLDSFPKAKVSEKLSKIFPYVQSLLLGTFLFLTPLILLVGLLVPFWGLGILAMLMLGVAWLELWQIFLVVGSGVYNHIAPFMLSDMTLESFISVYVYGVSVVHGIVSVFAILLLPGLVKALPFHLVAKPAKEKKEKPNIVSTQLEGVLQKFKESLPEKVKEHVLPEKQPSKKHVKETRLTNVHLTKQAEEKIKHTKRVEPHVSAIQERKSQKGRSVPRSPEVAMSAKSSAISQSGNAYGMFQKVVQENYMSLGHDAVNALQMTEKHMKHMTADDMRIGEDGGKKYVEVKQSALKEKIEGGEEVADGYVRFYQQK